MARSQLMCMEDGQIQENIPTSKPHFYYSEEHRVTLETLLKDEDGALTMRLDQGKEKDFLSAREIIWLRKNFKCYNTDVDEPEPEPESESAEVVIPEQQATADSSSLHSTYWPDLSDTEIPQLDIGWSSGGLFKGATRVNIYTHPPKEHEPHIKEVVRKLIQDAHKVVAIVMDLLTDMQILQDLMEAAARRRVAVYIILDEQGVPHFLDMCNRLNIEAIHLQNLRTRTLKGPGFSLSFGRINGGICSKYMIIDGDKVMFGSYSFSWCTSRMDRNMITVLSGQPVDFFERDFRELYAVSGKLNLYKEFCISKPGAASAAAAMTQLETPLVRSPVSVTSRFQVSLGDSGQDLKVPDHKFNNPKYLLVYGHMPTGSLQNLSGKKEPSLPEEVPEEEPAVMKSYSDKMAPVKRESKKVPKEKPKRKTNVSFAKLAHWFKRSSHKLVDTNDVLVTPPTSPSPMPDGPEEHQGTSEGSTPKETPQKERVRKLSLGSIKKNAQWQVDKDSKSAKQKTQKRGAQS